ncbi:uncharacterized protein An12g08010 [Aspergillus niger]|uniref:Contig An12c0270, genomic contig n=2 Tax=Aspergillus niger TaxID=5061 RepID=A2R0B3_ASPNC|nr:uncharacterized protein An12g08010 [Aspergillus niger]CAK41251.1 unnamed protein product [Aspergillus niger]
MKEAHILRLHGRHPKQILRVPKISVQLLQLIMQVAVLARLGHRHGGAAHGGGAGGRGGGEDGVSGEGLGVVCKEEKCLQLCRWWWVGQSDVPPATNAAMVCLPSGITLESYTSGSVTVGGVMFAPEPIQNSTEQLWKETAKEIKSKEGMRVKQSSGDGRE